MPKEFKNLTRTDHIMIQHFLTMMRRDKCKHNTYRMCLNNVCLFLAYEALQEFQVPVASVDLRTPSGHEVSNQRFILSDGLAIIAVMRGGMAPAGFLSTYFPKSPIGHIGASGGKRTGKAKVFFEKMPKKLHQKKCLVIAPRIETASSMVCILSRIQELRRDRSMSDIVVLNVVCSPQGVDRLLQTFPDVRIVTASLEDDVDRDGNVVPGIGHTGERIFGSGDVED